MKQESIKNEQEELIKRIKDSYETSKWGIKMFIIITVIWLLCVIGDGLTGGNLREWASSSIVVPILCFLSWLNYRFYNKMEPVEDARELLAIYKRYEWQQAVLFSFFIIVFIAQILYDKHGVNAAIIAVIISVVLSLICWFAGGFTDRNIKRLRKLVAQEDEKNEVNV